MVQGIFNSKKKQAIPTIASAEYFLLRHEKITINSYTKIVTLKRSKNILPYNLRAVNVLNKRMRFYNNNMGML